jgi:glycosyltransferase involved in cell wall biosynthesis
MFTPGLEGLLVRPRDSGALADALLELWRSPQLRAQMGSAGRAAVSTGYTLAGQCEQFQGLYRELASVT